MACALENACLCRWQGHAVACNCMGSGEIAWSAPAWKTGEGVVCSGSAGHRFADWQGRDALAEHMYAVTVRNRPFCAEAGQSRHVLVILQGRTGTAKAKRPAPDSARGSRLGTHLVPAAEAAPSGLRWQPVPRIRWRRAGRRVRRKCEP